ncbi:hypothetical protein GTW69_10800 [Streptomyces sp. SID7760]|nr:hypothetical protein [Streptomyces sp. SID7760]
MSRLGRPLREEMRTAATATSSTSEQTSRSSLSVWTVSGRPFPQAPGGTFLQATSPARSAGTSLPYLIFDAPFTRYPHCETPVRPCPRHLDPWRINGPGAAPMVAPSTPRTTLPL